MMFSESEVRSEVRSGLPRTYERTRRTNGEGLSPTSETSRFVTRTRAYEFEVGR